MILPNVDAILKAIEAGHGISVLPDYLVEAAVSAGRVQRIAPERFATNQLYVAYRTDSRHDPVLQQTIVAYNRNGNPVHLNGQGLFLFKKKDYSDNLQCDKL